GCVVRRAPGPAGLVEEGAGRGGGGFLLRASFPVAVRFVAPFAHEAARRVPAPAVIVSADVVERERARGAIGPRGERARDFERRLVRRRERLTRLIGERNLGKIWSGGGAVPRCTQADRNDQGDGRQSSRTNSTRHRCPPSLGPPSISGTNAVRQAGRGAGGPRARPRAFVTRRCPSSRCSKRFWRHWLCVAARPMKTFRRASAAPF